MKLGVIAGRVLEHAVNVPVLLLAVCVCVCVRVCECVSALIQ